jgi:hypothetical protein
VREKARNSLISRSFACDFAAGCRTVVFMRPKRIGRNKGEEMEKNFWSAMVYISAAAICMVLAPSAKAGCGHAVLPGGQPEKVQPWTAEADRAALTPAAEAAGYLSIVGLWLDTLTIGGQPAYQAFETFTIDGTEILNDNGAPQAGNVCLGVWAPTGRSTLKVNHPSWNYDGDGNVIGTVVIKTQITMDPGGNTYKGTVTIDVYDLNGKKTVPTTNAQLTATRITAN